MVQEESAMRVLIVIAIALVAAANGTQEPEDSSFQASGKRMVDCLIDADVHCMKLRALTNVYELLKSKTLKLMDGVQLDYSGDKDLEVATARAIVEHDWMRLFLDLLPKLSRGLSMKIGLFEGGHLRVARSQKDRGLVHIEIETDEDLKTARGHHKKRLILPLLAVGGFFAFLVTFGALAIKFFAFNSLLLGKMSLVISAVTGLARLRNKQNEGYGNGYGSADKNFNDYSPYNASPNVKRRQGWVAQPLPLQ